jgi:choice-of-anchor B domain-containing protein
MTKRMYLRILLVFTMTCLSSVIVAQETISLVGKLSITNLPIHDVWGYTDSATGDKYALLCASTSGLRVVDLSDITNPAIVGTISGNGVRAIDVKTWRNYAYVVGESLNLSGKIIDLTDPTNPTQVGTFPGGHNMLISDSGYMYVATPGIKIYDLNVDPVNPLLVYNDNSCSGHDVSISGNVLYDYSNNCGTRIFDISQPDTMISMGVVPPSGIFHHSGWSSQNGNYVFICDELALPAENDITVWDITNLSTPVMVDSFADPGAYVHNLYVINNYAYVSYYSAGFRLFDISDPTNISMVAEYDTDSALSGPGYGGNFGLFTLWGTDTILASDEENGLYVFSVTGLTTGIEDLTITDLQDVEIFPNPASNKTTIRYSTNNKSNVDIQIYDILGNLIYSVPEGIKPKGIYDFILNTEGLNKGIYFVKLMAGSATKTKKLVITE